MKFNNIYKRYLPVVCLALSMTAVSCIDESDNINPNEVTEDMMQADNLKTGSLFQQMQRYVIVVPFAGDDGNEGSSSYQVVQYLSHDLFSGYAGSTLGSVTNHNQYIWMDNWVSGTFELGFTRVMGGWKDLHEAAMAQGNEEIAALADIVKVAGMHRIADSFGPIPYVNYGSSNEYDALDVVYKKFFEELDNAIDVLSDYASVGGSLMSKYDLVYGGNATNWVKFANTLRLRLAMRVYYADRALAQAEVAKCMACPQGFVETKNERPEVSTTLLTYEYPIYKIAYDFNDGDGRPGASIVEIMKQFNDPRLSNYFTAVNGEYHGVPIGIRGSINRYQTECSNYNNMSLYGTPIVWMYAAESFFLRAEAALYGMNVGGDAKTFYESGISASCEEHGVSVGSYLSSQARLGSYTNNVESYTYSFKSNATPAWDDAADTEGKLERIITQKWIAMFPEGGEGWAEQRRTGYPDLINIMTNGSNGTIDSNLGPRRMPYPLNEKVNNAAGVASGVSKLGGPDNGGTKLWWDKK